MKMFAAVAAASVLVLTGCSVADPGVVELGASGTSACVDPAGESFTALIGVRVTGGTPVRVDAVTVSTFEGATVGEGWFVDGYSEGLTIDDAPPDDLEGWDDRVESVSAELEPGDYTLVLPVEHEPGETGSSGDIVLTYRGGTVPAEATSSVGFGFGESTSDGCE